MAARTAPFLRLKDGKWAVHPDGAALLSTITTPVCVVCVAGRYRTGKSFFLNTLATTTGERAESGFKVGSTSESCTRGIDLLLPDPEAAKPACGGTLVLLDTEGLASMDQDETYDAQVFALGLLLSSHFVLNQMGVIDESAIDQLYLVAELSKHVCVTAGPAGGGDGGAPPGDEAAQQQQLAQFFPPLLWLLRDFVVDLMADGEKASEHEYMEKALSERPPGARRAKERNQVRGAIRQLFPARTCRTLVRPATDEEAVRHAVSLTTEQLRPEFVAQLGAVRDELLAGAVVKTLFGVPLDGASLLALTTQYLEAMNTPDVVPSIRSAWEFVVEERSHAARAAALAAAAEALGALAATPPLPDGAAWAERAAALEAEAVAAFDARALAGAGVGEARQALRDAVRREATTQREALLRRSRQVCDDAATVAGAAALPEAAEAAAEGFERHGAVLGDLLQAYEEEAQGPCRYDGLRGALTSQLAPWLAQVAAATAAARAAAAAAARDALDAEREARRAVEAELATKAEAAARLEGSVAAQEAVGGELRARADELAAQLQAAQTARLEAQAASSEQLAAAQRELAAARSELQLSASQTELQLERAKAAGESAAMAHSAAMARLEQESDRAQAETKARLQAAEAAQQQTQAVMNTFRAEAMEAREAREAVASQLGAARAEAEAAKAAAQRAQQAEERARGEQVGRALDAYVAAVEAAEERGKTRLATQEECDALRSQLAELHERLALLPDFYVQQVFSGEKAQTLVDALVSDRDGGGVSIISDEQARRIKDRAGQVSEDFAASQVGNIAAAGAMLAPKIGSIAKSSWSWFAKGFAAEEDEEAEQAPEGAAAPAAASTARAPAAAPPANGGAPGNPMAEQQARLERMAKAAAAARESAQ